jgi:hypothetical protein
MRAHQTLRDLPHIPVPPQQKYALTEPTTNHCDILRITAQLGVMGKLNPQEFHLGQEVFNLGDNCNTATSTANFIQDLMDTKQVEVHFFKRIKELLHQKFNVQCQVSQLHLERRGTQFNIMPKSLDIDSAGIFPLGFPLYLCKKFHPYILAPRPLPCFGTLKTININLTINFTGWDNLPRLADAWSEEQQALQHFVSRETHRIQQQVRSPPPPMAVVAWPPPPKIEASKAASTSATKPIGPCQKTSADPKAVPAPTSTRVKITYDEMAPPIRDKTGLLSSEDSHTEQELPSKRARGPDVRTSSKEDTLGEDVSTSSNATTEDEIEPGQISRLPSEVHKMVPANAIALGLIQPPHTQDKSINDPDEHLQVNLPSQEREEFLDQATQPLIQPVVSCAPPPMDAPPTSCAPPPMDAPPTLSEESSQGSEVIFKIPRKAHKPLPDPLPVAEPSAPMPISLKDLSPAERELLHLESHEQLRASFKSDKHYERALKRGRDDSTRQSSKSDRTRPRDRGSRKRDDRYDYRDDGY